MMDEVKLTKVTEPSSTEAAIITAANDAVFDSELDNEDDVNEVEVEVVSEVEVNANNCNRLIIEGAADDEQYECKEPEIVKIARSVILKKWPEMKSEFSKCICLACNGNTKMSPKFYW
jgi:hypothetical protein